MLNALKRYEIQLLVAVGHTQAEVAKFAGVSTSARYAACWGRHQS
jgi:hypothetical protein